jgi:hypothetical protein
MYNVRIRDQILENQVKGMTNNTIIGSVVDPHRFDADPDTDPNLNFKADQDPNPDWHQNDAQ